MTDILDAYIEMSPPGGVFGWGKSPEATARDLADGVARMGGFRAPSYDKAYLFAASKLLQISRASGSYDHHGLPIFFLQRHAAELMMKGPLRLALEIQRLRELVRNVDLPAFPTSKAQRERIDSCHHLSKLLRDMDQMVKAMEVGGVPNSLVDAIFKIEAVEKKDAAWSRYEISIHVEAESTEIVQHLKDEVVLPLVSIQGLLEAADQELGLIWPNDGVMGRLGEKYQEIGRRAGLFD